MMELIGFWSGVTLYTFLFLLLPLLVLVVAVDLWVDRVTDGDVPDCINSKLSPFLYKIGYLCRTRSGEEIHGFAFGLHFISFITVLLSTLEVYMGDTDGIDNYYDIASAFGEVLAPWFGWVTVAALILFVLDSFAKRMYKLGKKVNKVLGD